MQNNDSVKKTVLVATLLCLFCSIIVSLAAVKLKPLQVENKIFDVKVKLLVAAGLATPESSKEDVLSAYENINPVLVELDSGDIVDDFGFDLKKSLKDSNLSSRIEKDNDFASILFRAKHAKVFIVKDGDSVGQYIFPIYGKGLWSTMYAFLALSSDFKKVLGVGFYDHGETPGLGGEIENAKWQKSWINKDVYSDELNLLLTVIKGKVDYSEPTNVHQIDGLSGATLTTVGVDRTIKFWLGENGFLPFIKKQLEGGM
ncbi:MAG: Na(+)-translocating NADH-quinone reductase subunit C [Bacteriovoracaceae bacterium]|nr:Na(+)-translocating NADH-quinone reductase subunit C [Bacteriovoracaceae bacterium]